MVLSPLREGKKEGTGRFHAKALRANVGFCVGQEKSSRTRKDDTWRAPQTGRLQPAYGKKAARPASKLKGSPRKRTGGGGNNVPKPQKTHQTPDPTTPTHKNLKHCPAERGGKPSTKGPTELGGWNAKTSTRLYGPGEKKKDTRNASSFPSKEGGGPSDRTERLRMGVVVGKKRRPQPAVTWRERGKTNELQGGIQKEKKGEGVTLHTKKVPKKRVGWFSSRKGPSWSREKKGEGGRHHLHRAGKKTRSPA